MNTAGIGIAVTATVNNLFLNNSTFHSTAPLVFLDTTASVTTMMNTLAINTSNTNAFVSNSNNPKFINTIAAIFLVNCIQLLDYSISFYPTKLKAESKSGLRLFHNKVL